MPTEQWIDVGPAASVTETQTLLAEVDGFSVVVARCGNEYYAVEDRCTHDGAPLGDAEIEDCRIICPRHGAQFSLRDGEALTPPAYEPLRTFKVREQDGRLLIEAPA
jgi:3-phenylpropionate/trans-cinnamate dioxygenase ferredoxin component